MRKESEDADGAPSLFQRLSEQFGASVDPRVSLEEGGRAAPEPGAPAAPTPEPTAPASSRDSRRPASSGILGRLSSRPIVGGRYRVDGEIARGGMGAILDVWDEDLRRRLAMKVALGKGEDGSSASTDELDPRMLARFLEEAQVTGQLEHPGIVPVHELGMDESGQVFFTMRRVQGRDLEAIFRLVAEEREGWTLTRAVGVLQKICEAMAYAHSKGVIHRDLKPANVMVGRFGEVYVMDWGLVRVQGHEDRHDVRVASIDALSEAGIAVAARDDESVKTDPREDGSGHSGDALYTMDGDVLGTPAYMPPEQARGDLELLDARSDVYSLGAMLYRLLSGFAPFSDDGVRKGAMGVVRELRTRPPRALAELAPTAPVELIAISEKAMSRDPARRYADMAAFGEDLQAFLEQRVVGAFETGAWAEARKWVRRNRPLAASLAAGLLVLVGGLAFSLVQKQRADDNATLAEARSIEASENAALAAASAAEAKEAARVAEERRVEAIALAAEAARQARVAEQTNDFLNNDLLAAVDPELQGYDVTVREILLNAGDRLEERFADEPLVEAELRKTIGNSLFILGDLDAALPHSERAFALLETEYGFEHEETLGASSDLAMLLSDMGRYDQALETYDEVIKVSRDVLGPTHESTLTAMRHQATALIHIGERARAEELLLAVRAAESDPSRPFHENSLLTAGSLGVLYSDQGRFEEAEQELRAVLRLSRLVRGESHLETYMAMSNLSVVLSDLAQYDAAYELELASVEGRRRLLGPEHQNVGQGLVNLGVIDTKVRRYDQAEELTREGLQVLRDSLDGDHDRVLLAESNLAVVLNQLGRGEEALALREETLASLRRVYGEDHPTTLLAQSNQAILLLQLDRLEESRRAHEELLELSIGALGPDHPQTLTSLENYANVLFMLGDYDRSIPTIEVVLAGRRRVFGEEHPDIAKTLFNLGSSLQNSGRPERALESFEEAAALFERTVGLENPMGAACFKAMGEVHDDVGAYAEARVDYARALEILRADGTDDQDVGYLLHQVAYDSLKLGEHETALAQVEEAVEQRTRVAGPDTHDAVQSRYLRAGILGNLKRYEEALPDAHAFHTHNLEAHPPAHPDSVKGRQALDILYTRLGRDEEAERYR